ncbi:GNAT family N-acetyltransferase [Solirubrobacter phytolaccae]|uniref:GNAT family N-acetyltransferase n=1 Tax=Solirubrobacter phytolaccae TaxID=1404360 RepID=A0A9X3SC74_9ACTN|nr:GNAT family N-acetyltransferase [Solirubrobacter phytolaccae]MDA0185508.1 GNAT family N-acetyltransferase [Solirubrobacter phytolaccae]
MRRIRGDSEVAQELLVAMEAYVEADLGPVTPETTSTVDPTEMNPPDGAYVIVLEDGVPVAGGGVRRLSADVAEVKRMYTLPDARGRGHGRRLLSALEDAARELGYARVRLDTAANMDVARRMYGEAGYEEIGDYNGNSYAVFWGEKAL